MTINGPLPVNRAPAFNNGCDTARMITAARTKRRIRSHRGVLAELSCRVFKPNSRRTGGNRIVIGIGGVSLKNHQITGNVTSAARAKGAAKDMAPTLSTAQSPVFSDSTR